MKDKLFKLLFPGKAEELKELEEAWLESITMMNSALNDNQELNEKLKEAQTIKPITEAQVMTWCVQTLGIPYLSMADVDDEAHPPHYLSDLSEDERKVWISSLENIYSSQKFQAVIAYVINLLGNFSLQKAEDDKMRNGKIGIIAIRTLMTEFANAHKEFMDRRKPEEEFDPLEVMPG
jgi:hypothetical protein